ncbi:MAG: hypothetical protein AB8E15_08865 [Bdellovibrionales bacterium]
MKYLSFFLFLSLPLTSIAEEKTKQCGSNYSKQSTQNIGSKKNQGKDLSKLSTLERSKIFLKVLKSIDSNYFPSEKIIGDLRNRLGSERKLHQLVNDYLSKPIVSGTKIDLLLDRILDHSTPLLRHRLRYIQREDFNFKKELEITIGREAVRQDFISALQAHGYGKSESFIRSELARGIKISMGMLLNIPAIYYLYFPVYIPNFFDVTRKVIRNQKIVDFYKANGPEKLQEHIESQYKMAKWSRYSDVSLKWAIRAALTGVVVYASYKLWMYSPKTLSESQVLMNLLVEPFGDINRHPIFLAIREDYAVDQMSNKELQTLFHGVVLDMYHGTFTQIFEAKFGYLPMVQNDPLSLKEWNLWISDIHQNIGYTPGK